MQSHTFVTAYDVKMTRTRPDLPERMTWDELCELPEEIAREIELRDGRPVWVMRTAPPAHQGVTGLLWSALRNCRPRLGHGDTPEPCFRAYFETNVFFTVDKSDYCTPDFLVSRCLPTEFDWIHSPDVFLVGEVLSASNTEVDVAEKKLRYERAGIPWYWEVTLSREPAGVRSVRIYGLAKTPGELPGGVHSLRASNYVLAGAWTRADAAGIAFEQPYPIRIAWHDLTLD